MQHYILSINVKAISLCFSNLTSLILFWYLAVDFLFQSKPEVQSAFNRRLAIFYPGDHCDVADENASLKLVPQRSGPMQHGTTKDFKLNLKGAYRGFVLGMAVASGILAAIVMFFYDANMEKTENAQLNYLISDIVLQSLMVVAILTGMYSMHKLEMKHNIQVEVDDMLLLIAMSGSFLFKCQ